MKKTKKKIIIQKEENKDNFYSVFEQINKA